MVLTICSEGAAAIDFPFLFQQGPAEARRLPFSLGHLDVFFTRSETDKTTIALVLTADAVLMAPKPENLVFNGPPLTHYLRPQAFLASSLLSLALEEAYPGLLDASSSTKHSHSHHLTVELAPVHLPGEPGQWDKLWTSLGYQVQTSPLKGKDLFACQLKAEKSLPELLQHLQVLGGLNDPQWPQVLQGDTIQTILQRSTPWLSTYQEAEWVATQLQPPTSSQQASRLHQLAPEKQLDQGTSTLMKFPQRDQAISSLFQELECKRVLLMENVNAPLCWHLVHDKPDLHLTVCSSKDQDFRAAANFLLQQPEWSSRANQVAFLPASIFHKDEDLKGHDAVLIPEVFPQLPRFRQQQLIRNLFEEVKAPCIVFTATFSQVKPANAYQRQIQKAAKTHGYGARLLEVPAHEGDSDAICYLAFLHPLPNA